MARDAKEENERTIGEQKKQKKRGNEKHRIGTIKKEEISNSKK